jgi:hypothetical protein
MTAEQIKDSHGKATGEYRYDGAVANRALELLGKELGMFVDKHELDQTVKVISDEPMTSDEWQRRYEAGLGPSVGTSESSH